MTINRMTRIFKGFTIIELLVVIAIIGVLAVVSVVSFGVIQSNVRNTQRSSEISVVSEALEKYYEQNGEYPDCTKLTSDPDIVTSSVLRGMDPNVLSAPTATSGTNSFTCGTSPISDTYAYIGGGSYYILQYKEEGSGTIVSIASRQSATAGANTNALTLTAGTGGTVSQSGTSPYTGGATPTITATASSNYVFSSWTGSAGCSGAASHSITIDANKSCIANFTATSIATPIVPTVAQNTSGVTTTWSWNAASCPGNTARYQ
jgi:type IV pilus assembly protein PilE